MYADGITGMYDPETGEPSYFPVVGPLPHPFPSARLSLASPIPLSHCCSFKRAKFSCCVPVPPSNPPPKLEQWLQAPFVYHDGRQSVAFQSTGYYTEQEEPEVPRLTPPHLEALRTVQASLSVNYFLLEPIPSLHSHELPPP